MRRSGAVMAAALLLTACGGDDGESTTPITDPAAVTSTTEESSTTSTTEDPEAAIEQAYYDQWDAFVEILSNPDPANPLIEEHFAGAAKQALLDTISRDIRDGVVTRVPEDPTQFELNIESIEIESPIRAVLTECIVDGLVAVDRTTGAVLDDDVVVVRGTNVFERVEGSWKVTDTRFVEELDSCDV